MIKYNSNISGNLFSSATDSGCFKIDSSVKIRIPDSSLTDGAIEASGLVEESFEVSQANAAVFTKDLIALSGTTSDKIKTIYVECFKKQDIIVSEKIPIKFNVSFNGTLDVGDMSVLSMVNSSLNAISDLTVSNLTGLSTGESAIVKVLIFKSS